LLLEVVLTAPAFGASRSTEPRNRYPYGSANTGKGH
jgi:hypothetical protein